MWERAPLEEFEARRVAGANPGTLVRSEFVVGDDRWTFRYRKAIPTRPVCTVCHAKDITPGVTDALDHQYPENRARISGGRHSRRIIDHAAGAISIGQPGPVPGVSHLGSKSPVGLGNPHADARTALPNPRPRLPGFHGVSPRRSGCMNGNRPFSRLGNRSMPDHVLDPRASSFENLSG